VRQPPQTARHPQRVQLPLQMAMQVPRMARELAQVRSQIPRTAMLPAAQQTWGLLLEPVPVSPLRKAMAWQAQEIAGQKEKPGPDSRPQTGSEPRWELLPAPQREKSGPDSPSQTGSEAQLAP